MGRSVTSETDSNGEPRPTITLALTGASGADYGLRLLACLLSAGRSVDLLLSDAARTVLEQECDLRFSGDGSSLKTALMDYFSARFQQEAPLTALRHFDWRDWGAPMASGSIHPRPMVICPCSMGTLAAVAHGLSDTLIERAADVCIKERWPLILVPRESPFSTVHLQNMLSLSQMGVTILPAAPGFYHRPRRLLDLVDFIVARILDQLQVPHRLLPRGPDHDGNWGRRG